MPNDATMLPFQCCFQKCSRSSEILSLVTVPFDTRAPPDVASFCPPQALRWGRRTWPATPSLAASPFGPEHFRDLARLSPMPTGRACGEMTLKQYSGCEKRQSSWKWRSTRGGQCMAMGGVEHLGAQCTWFEARGGGCFAPKLPGRLYDGGVLPPGPFLLIDDDDRHSVVVLSKFGPTRVVGFGPTPPKPPCGTSEVPRRAQSVCDEGHSFL